MSLALKAAAVVGLAASLLALYAILSGPGGTPLAFAEVALKLRDARTLSFDEVVTLHDGTTSAGRNYFMVPGKHRHEMQQHGDAGFVVMDFTAGKLLAVSTTRKTAFVSPIHGKTERDFAGKMIDDIRSLDEKGARSLGEKEIDGVRAKGFETDSEIRKTTVWADSKTGDPLRIEVVLKRAPGGPAKDVMTNFKLDEPLDPALFGLVPPPGYKTMPSIALDLNATPADHVAGLLKIYARHMDGKLPTKLEDAGKALADKLKPKADEPPSEELLKLVSHGAGVAALTTMTKRGERWQYDPTVELGQKDRIVFWYHDAKKNTYHAVYGDLRVEKVAKEQLPPKP
jgi:outer membrane lipoprotein-sorting protein